MSKETVIGMLLDLEAQGVKVMLTKEGEDFLAGKHAASAGEEQSA